MNLYNVSVQNSFSEPYIIEKKDVKFPYTHVNVVSNRPVSMCKIHWNRNPSGRRSSTSRNSSYPLIPSIMPKLLRILTNSKQPLDESPFFGNIIRQRKTQPGIARVKPRFQRNGHSGAGVRWLASRERTFRFYQGFRGWAIQLYDHLVRTCRIRDITAPPTFRLNA